MESTPTSPDGEPTEEDAHETLGPGGRFHVLKTLGAGAMGSVCLARDTQLRRLVAIKTVRAELAEDEAFAKRIERECVLHATVGMHPNIVMIFDTFREDQRLHMVMEYVEGETLQSLLERNAREGVSLTAQRSILICTQVLDALSRIHAQGVVHRDIKPSNIMIARDESGAPIAKLTDFGIARAEAAQERLTQITAAGSGAPGTPLYMAPEQIDAATFGPVTPAADIYAMGALLYQLFSGEPPFRGTLTEVLHAHLQLSPPPLRSSLLGVVPEEMDRVLRRALAKRPADRWPSVQAFRSELLRLEAELPRPGLALTDSKSPTEPMPQYQSGAPVSSSQDEPTMLSGTGLKRLQQKKTRAAILAVAATLVLGGAGGLAAWQTLRGTSSPEPPAQAIANAPESATPSPLVAAPGSTPVTPAIPTVAEMPTVPATQSPVTPAVAPNAEPIVVEAPLAIVDEPTLPAEPPSEYVVQAGQTLSKIAALYQLDMRDVQWWNGMKDPNSLSVGQTLYLHKRDGLPPREQFFAQIAPPPTEPPKAEETTTPLVPSESAEAAAAPSEEKPGKPKKRGWWPFSRKKQGDSN